MFQLTPEEAELSRSQFATLKPGRGQNIKYRPYAFTEHCAIQAANVLSVPRAVEMGVFVVRAFGEAARDARIQQGTGAKGRHWPSPCEVVKGPCSAASRSRIASNELPRYDWEGTGVEPDIKVPAADALTEARKRATEQSNTKPTE